jgi:sulfur-carrier protein adenylyltransferase/sulfurtransferase
MENDFTRYSCQLALPDFGMEAQQRLQNCAVLIVGAGGLGCPAAQYLTAAGVGKLAIADFDVVNIRNLHRQVLYNPEEKGLNKAVVACKKLQLQNPAISLIPMEVKIDVENVMSVISDYDIVVDCTDNFDTRYLLNDACVLAGKPLVYGAIYQYEGQVAVWNILNKSGSRTPNYRDLFPEVNAAQIPSCSEGGVIPTLAGIIGCLQANEVIKYITGSWGLLAGKLLIFNAKTGQSRVVKIPDVTQTNITALPQTEMIPVISSVDLQEGLSEEKYLLVDVRTFFERQQSNILGGEHIPLDQLQNKLGELKIAKPVVFYCSSGKRSAEAVKIIRKIFPGAEAYSLEGGLEKWGN